MYAPQRVAVATMVEVGMVHECTRSQAHVDALNPKHSLVERMQHAQ